MRLKWNHVLWGSLGLSGLGCAYFYNTNKAVRNVCNLLYAGANIFYIYKFTNESDTVKNTNASEYLRDALMANGGIYLKLGQLIATLDVIVPDEYRITMGSLTRECVRTSYENVKKTINEELGYPVEVLFQSLEQEPIYSASIGQVHRGVLLGG
ncbi:unnamed protein product [Sphagnum balticum]